MSWVTPIYPLIAPDDAAIHVWRVCIADHASTASQLESLLNGDEVARARRFRIERDRLTFAITRAALRDILGSYLNETPQSIHFSYEPHGKPTLALGHSDDVLTFNVSHSDGLAFIAVARNRAIGIDIERVRAICDLDQLIRSCCTSHEQAFLDALDTEERLQTFFAIWTVKEAYIKARGIGLSLPPNAVEITPCCSPQGLTMANFKITAVWGDMAEAARYTALLLPNERRYASCLISDVPHADLSCWEWSLHSRAG